MTLTKEEIVEKINLFLIDEFEVDEDEIRPEANLKDALDLDSLDTGHSDCIVAKTVRRVILEYHGLKVGGN